jgi:hypothetical protein
MTVDEARAAIRLALDERRARLLAREPLRDVVERWQAMTREALDVIYADAHHAYREQRNKDAAWNAARERER